VDSTRTSRAHAYHRVSSALGALYHGTFRDAGISPGDRLSPQHEGWEHLGGEIAEAEEALERFRPPGALARDACVYMVADPSEAARVSRDYDIVWEVRPDPPVEASDLGWYAAFDRKWREIDESGPADREQGDVGAALAAADPEDLGELRRLAAAYWGGDPHPAGLTEYRAPSATALREATA